MKDEQGPVGIVLAGGGARGAYEAGALSVIMPWLAERGEPARVLVWTSAGALNAILFAPVSVADDVAGAAEKALEVWRGLRRGEVFRPLLATEPANVIRYLASVVGLSGLLPSTFGASGVTSVLDVTPLGSLVKDVPDWAGLHAAIEAGDLSAVAVVATSMSNHRTDVFYEAGPGASRPKDDPVRAVRYSPCRLRAAHALASAAIPVAFPPVRIKQDWYLDGGVRLNSPIKPAISLGAGRLVVMATHPVQEHAWPAPASHPAVHDTAAAEGTQGSNDLGNTPAAPDVVTAAASVLHSVLVDRMVEDIRTLGRVNDFILSGADVPGYRAVPYVAVAPDVPGRVSALAARVLRERYAGARGLFGGDFTMLNRLLGGNPAAHGEIFSFLLFDEEFISDLIDLGAADARAAIAAAGENPWELPG